MEAEGGRHCSQILVNEDTAQNPRARHESDHGLREGGSHSLSPPMRDGKVYLDRSREILRRDSMGL